MDTACSVIVSNKVPQLLISCMISNWYFAYHNIDSEDDQSISFHETFGNKSFEIKVMSI